VGGLRVASYELRVGSGRGKAENWLVGEMGVAIFRKDSKISGSYAEIGDWVRCGWP
jgi:hypothetical protein